LSRVPAERHIAYAWSVQITGSEYIQDLPPTQSYSSVAAEVCRRYMDTTLQPPLLRPFAIECHGSITQPTLFAIPDLLILRMSVTLKHSDPYLLFDPTQARRSMLALPRAIDFAESTATIRRIRDLICSELSMCLSEGWQELPPKTSRSRKVHHTLRLDWVEHGPSLTKSGSRTTTQTKKSKRPARRSARKIR